MDSEVREGFEKKHRDLILDLLFKLNASTSALYWKTLTILLCQGIIFVMLSQLNGDPEEVIGEDALIIVSLVFAAFAILSIYRHHLSTKQIRHEINLLTNNEVK